MTSRNIKTELEYVQNQVAYLEKYQVKIQDALRPLNTFSRKWNGLGKEELVYKEIDRWLKCYEQLSSQVKMKQLSDETLQALIHQLPAVKFVKPTNFNEDAIKGVKGFLYKVLPPYRIAYNKRKIKEVKTQVASFAQFLKEMKSLSYKIEAYYMDGV